MTEEEIKDIAIKLFQGKATPEEEGLLHQWYEAKGYNQEELLVVQTEGETSEDVKTRLFSSIQDKLKKEEQREGRYLTSKNKWLLYVAASLLLFTVIGGFYFKLSDSSEEPIRYTQLLEGDVGPGGNNAVLELGNGVTINLDEAGVGELDNVDGLTIKKQANGVLSIEVDHVNGNIPVEMNAIRTPAGGQYQIRLSDGTMVWLNASSIIKFPSLFGDDLREVELEGEAYFEVAKVVDGKNALIPFFVKNNEQRIEVLGTHFNVSSYPKEFIKTTLLEGSVRVHSLASNSSQVLKPGQQSQLVNGGIKIETADMESSLAWKNGDFIFNNEELHSIMSKLERWYDVQVEYKGAIVPRRFSGAVSRSKNLSEVLKIMEFTGKVTFKIEGRRVLAMM